ncbi:hypothetical protein [Streptomyces sp. NPDC047043]|uniref:hypothetical protein n=1 Tax=Streptomyces sp. NPDC047043 TaxID=3154497 RepID=UPI0033CEA602
MSTTSPQDSYIQPTSDPAPTPKRRRIWLVLGIAGGVVAVIVANVVATGGKGESGLPEAEFALTLPKTLLDNRYELTQDLSDTAGQNIQDMVVTEPWADRVTDAKVATYSLGGVEADGALMISGVEGRFQSVDGSRDGMMAGVGQTEGVTVTVKPKDFHPHGSDITVTCEVATQQQADDTLTFPVCAWADGNTAAAVAHMAQEAYTQSPSDVDLAAAAETTLKVRSETRKAIR